MTFYDISKVFVLIKVMMHEKTDQSMKNMQK